MSGNRKSRRIPPQLRRQVWETYMTEPNSTNSPCYVCGTDVHYSTFECGHVISHAHGGEITLENLRPICSSCNKSMGSRNLEEFKSTFFCNLGNPPSNQDKKLKHKTRVLQRKTDSEQQHSDDCEARSEYESWNTGYASDEEVDIVGCRHVLLSGPRKGKYCNRETVNDKFCILHKDNNNTAQNARIGCKHLVKKNDRQVWCDLEIDKDDLCVLHYTMKQMKGKGGCQHVLLQGSRKGRRCNRDSYGETYCSYHHHMHDKQEITDELRYNKIDRIEYKDSGIPRLTAMMKRLLS